MMGGTLQAAINALRAAGKEDEAQAVEELRGRHAENMRQYDAGQRASYKSGWNDARTHARMSEPTVVDGEPKAGRSMCSDQDAQIAGKPPVGASRGHQKGHCSEGSDSAPSTTAGAPAGMSEPCKGGLCDMLSTGEPACEPGECWAKEWRARSEVRTQTSDTPAATGAGMSEPNPWEEEARRYAENAAYWRARAEACENYSRSTPPAVVPEPAPIGHLHSNGDFCLDRMPEPYPKSWPVPLYAAPAAMREPAPSYPAVPPSEEKK